MKKQLLYILLIQFFTFSFNGITSKNNKLENQLKNIEDIELDIEQIIKTNFTYGAVKIKNNSASKKYGSNYGFFILSKKKKAGFHINLEGYFCRTYLEVLIRRAEYNMYDNTACRDHDGEWVWIETTSANETQGNVKINH